MAKELSKSRYKWYRPHTEEASPAMAKFFYDIYKVIGSAQVMLDECELVPRTQEYYG